MVFKTCKTALLFLHTSKEHEMRKRYQDKLGGDWVAFSPEEVAQSGAALLLSSDSHITPRTVYVSVSDLPAMQSFMDSHGIDPDDLPIMTSKESSIRKCRSYDPSWLMVDVRQGRVFLFQDEPYIVDKVDPYDRGRVTMISMNGQPPKRATFPLMNIYALIERDPREDPLMDLKDYIKKNHLNPDEVMPSPQAHGYASEKQSTSSHGMRM